VEKYCTASSIQMTKWRVRIACRITEAIYTYSEHVILISFPNTTMFARTRLNVAFMLKLLILFFLDYNHEDKNVLAGTRAMPRADHALITTGPAVADGIIGSEHLTPCHVSLLLPFPVAQT
jgi:hypothetical protein